MNMTTTTAKIRSRDGQLVRVHPDGREEVLEKKPIRPMTEEESHAAALADPDTRPLTPEEMKLAKPTPRARIIRRALRLTQEEFAKRYHIPIGTLRDWEQGRAEPDQPARAYLRAIAGDPHAVLRALEARPVDVMPG
jgi:putative transcriptional regulator